MKPLRKKAISKSPVFPLPSFCLPLEKLERRTGSFVDETLRERHADLLFWVPRADGEVLVYVLFEHQSREDPLMGFRLLNYMTRIWAEELRVDPGRRGLPPVLPLVLHQNERRWKASREFRSLIELPPGEGGEAMDEFIPDFRSPEPGSVVCVGAGLAYFSFQRGLIPVSQTALILRIYFR